MSNRKPLTDHIASAARGGDRFYLCRPVVGELFFAVYASTRLQQNMLNLRGLLMSIPILEFDGPAAEEYGRIKAELKTKGRPIPGIDAQIAAICRIHQLTVLSADRHFSQVNDLSVENWL